MGVRLPGLVTAALFLAACAAGAVSTPETPGPTPPPVASPTPSPGPGPGPTPTPSPTPTPTGTVTVRVRDVRGWPVPADGFAYQTATGPWQAQPPGSADYSFSLPAGEARYGFTVRCGTAVYTFQATTAEGERWTVFCPPPGPAAWYRAEFDRSAVPEASLFVLYDARGEVDSSTAPAGSFLATGRWQGTQDLVGVAYDARTVARALRLLPDVSPPGGNYRFVLGPQDAAGPGGSVGDFSASVPAGWPFSFARAWYVSPRRTTALLAYLPGPGGGAFPGPRELRGGSYAVEAVATDRVAGLVRHAAAGLAPHLLPALPPPFSRVGVDLGEFPTFAELSYPHDPALPLHGFALSLVWQDTWVWAAVVAKSWLGRAAYTFPDLTSLPGFTGVRPTPSFSWSATAFSAQPASSEAATLARMAQVQTVPWRVVPPGPGPSGAEFPDAAATVVRSATALGRR